jgi:hypothetical protein
VILGFPEKRNTVVFSLPAITFLVPLPFWLWKLTFPWQLRRSSRKLASIKDELATAK